MKFASGNSAQNLKQFCAGLLPPEAQSFRSCNPICLISAVYAPCYMWLLHPQHKLYYLKRSSSLSISLCPVGLGECNAEWDEYGAQGILLQRVLCFCGTRAHYQRCCVCAGKEAGHRSRCCLCGPVTSLQLLFSGRATRKMKAEQIFDGKETKGSPPTCVLLFHRVLEKRSMCISLCNVRECALGRSTLIFFIDSCRAPKNTLCREEQLESPWTAPLNAHMPIDWSRVCVAH